MSNNEFKKDSKNITSHLSGAHVDRTESVLKPKKRQQIYKILAYILIAVVLIIFVYLVIKSKIK